MKNYEEYMILITALAINFSKEFSDEELGVLAAFFNQLGDTIVTILATKELK